MAQLINVFVCNQAGRGQSGWKVKLYGGDPVKTDNDGVASLLAGSGTINVYVDGMEVYEGSASNAPDPIVVYRG